MKRTVGIVIISIIAVLLIIAGTFRLVKRYVAGELDARVEVDSRQDENVKTETFEGPLDPFTSIDIDTDISTIRIESGDTYSISWNVEGTSTPTYEVKNGVLVVKQKHPKRHPDGDHNCEILITLPKDVNLDKCSIDSNVGDIRVKEMKCSELSAESDVGDIYFGNSDVGAADLQADVGNIELTDCNFTNLEIDSDVGDIEVSTDMDLSDYSFDLKSDVGKVRVNGDNHNKKFEHHGSNAYRIKAEASVGEIEITMNSNSDTI